MNRKIEFGNAVTTGKDHRGWFIGKFISDLQSIRKTDDLEIRWSTFQKGEKRPGWVTSNVTHTICILISGRFDIIFPENNYKLSKPGDYVIWGPRVAHKWHAIENSTVISIRWPSDPNDSIPLTNLT